MEQGKKEAVVMEEFVVIEGQGKEQGQVKVAVTKEEEEDDYGDSSAFIESLRRFDSAMNTKSM